MDKEVAMVSRGGGGGGEETARRPRIEMTAKNLWITVGEGKKEKHALTNVSAKFGAAQLTALMGPSGAGKTTLLNALTGIGRITGGEILFNGAPRPRSFMAMCAVIPQEDTLYGALTPRETFTYVARLRLGDNVPLEEKKRAVETMLAKLELLKCADTKVGNEDIRGISGGEKKRTSIGCELMVNPAVLFVDEPTSGLDAKMARSVVEHLQSLAHGEGRTVVTVIHQPSWRIFQLFDSLVLLQDGRTVYDGPVREVKDYFGRCGFAAPPDENPMDYYFDVLQEQPGNGSGMSGRDAAELVEAGVKGVLTATASPESTAAIAPSPLAKGEEGGGGEGGDGAGEGGSNYHGAESAFAVHWKEELVRRGEASSASSSASSVEVAADGGGGGSDADVLAAAEAAAAAASRTSSVSQFLTLSDRCCYDYVRDQTKLIGGVALKLSIGTLFGLIWLNQARGKRTQATIFTTEGPIFFCCFSAVFDTLLTLVIKYPLTRALIQREYRNRYYSVGPYFFAELLARSLFECANAILLATPPYLLVGLELSGAQFGTFAGVLCVLSICGAGLGICVGTLSKDIQEAQGLVIPILMPLMLFSGFFVPYNEIPVFFRWLYEISFLRYAFNILKMNQWEGLNFDDCDASSADDVCPMTCYADGDEYLEDTNASTLSKEDNFAILLGIMAVMVSLSFFIMRYAIIKKATTG